MPTLVGSWEFTATPNSGAHAFAPSFEGLATFTSDGSVVETDTSVWPGASGHGIWQNGPIPGGYLFVRFTSLIAHFNGALHAKRTVTMTITVNSTGDGFDGSYGFEIVNTKGDVIATGSGDITGQLMKHPLLP
jgi:hypothetical protein